MSSYGPLSDPAISARAKVRRRILPYLFVLYIIAYLDRANVAFAKLRMSADLGFSEAVFGFGAGIFFIGYLVLEVPGAILVERWSARKWISRILITWGLCTVAVGFVRSPNEFYTARFLLGAAEAGFFPGLIIYVSHWFPRADRARAVAGFVTAIPVSLVLGAPLSAWMLDLNWLGMAGWRWIFILQGLPAVIFGIITIKYLTDHPRQAHWLFPEEREWLAGELEREKRETEAAGKVSVWEALRHRNVILLAVALCIANTGGYSFVFWMPTILKNASQFSVTTVTALSALPFAMAILTILLLGRNSDRSGERRYHTAIPMFLSAIFFACAGIQGLPFPFVLAGLCLTAAAGYCWPPAFWVLPTLTLTETAAAASIGLINSIGNLGGFIGPTVIGSLLTRGYTQSFTIFLLASCFAVAGLLILLVRIPAGMARGLQSEKNSGHVAQLDRASAS